MNNPQLCNPRKDLAISRTRTSDHESLLTPINLRHIISPSDITGTLHRLLREYYRNVEVWATKQRGTYVLWMKESPELQKRQMDSLFRFSDLYF